MTKTLSALKETAAEEIAGRIYMVQGEKVMPDGGSADLYGVEAGSLKQAVKRNYRKFLPFAFTERGAARPFVALRSGQRLSGLTFASSAFTPTYGGR